MVRRLYPLSLLICLISLVSCASQGMMLVHPQSGATIKCGAASVGFMAGIAGGFVEECLRSYERQGYVPVEKLTPEQRTDLERRGVLPKPAGPPERTMQY